MSRLEPAPSKPKIWSETYRFHLLIPELFWLIYCLHHFNFYQCMWILFTSLKAGSTTKTTTAVEESNILQHGKRMKAKVIMPQNQLMFAGLAHTQISVKQQKNWSWQEGKFMSTFWFQSWEKKIMHTALTQQWGRSSLKNDVTHIYQRNCTEIVGCANITERNILYLNSKHLVFYAELQFMIL